MEAERALEIVLREGTDHEQYPEALQHVVELATELSSGRKPSAWKAGATVRIVDKTKPEYIIASLDGLESVTLDPADKTTPVILERHRSAGMIITPYRYTAYYDEEGDQMTLTYGTDLGAKLCECLHEKRHSRKSEGGLKDTRLERRHYLDDCEDGSRMGEAGLIEEAACDIMAEYDMLVLSHMAPEKALGKMLRSEVSYQRRAATVQKKLMEKRHRALAENTPQSLKTARLLLARFGEYVADSYEECRLYPLLEKAILAGDEDKAASIKREIGVLLRETQPEVSAMIESGTGDLEDMLHCVMAHYSHYYNTDIEVPVRRLMHYVSPPPADVAAGRAKNPFIDLIGIHEGIEDLQDSLSYAARAARLGKKRLLSELGRESENLTKQRLAERYGGLRHLYILAATVRKRRLSIEEHLDSIASGSYSKAFGEDVERFLDLFSKQHE